MAPHKWYEDSYDTIIRSMLRYAFRSETYKCTSSVDSHGGDEEDVFVEEHLTMLGAKSIDGYERLERCKMHTIAKDEGLRLLQSCQVTPNTTTYVHVMSTVLKLRMMGAALIFPLLLDAFTDTELITYMPHIVRWMGTIGM